MAPGGFSFLGRGKMTTTILPTAIFFAGLLRARNTYVRLCRHIRWGRLLTSHLNHVSHRHKDVIWNSVVAANLCEWPRVGRGIAWKFC
jgi:hypothetical protein